jgi:hypothetical protein
MRYDSQLEEFQRTHSLPGLRESAARQRLSTELARSVAWHRALRWKQGTSLHDPALAPFDPISAIRGYIGSGNLDEACWLAFLSVQFGWDGQSHGTGELIRRFYGRLGHKNAWRWPLVARNPRHVSSWLVGNLAGFRGVRFGNHRKFESLRSNSKQGGTGPVIESFVAWVRRRGGSGPFEALEQICSQCRSSEEAFDQVFRQLKILRWGRTAKFDFLVLLNYLGLLAIRPAHCYLRGSTGPRAGALLLHTGKRVGRLTPATEQAVEQLRAHLGLPAEVMEDALCNWQKTASNVGLRTALHRCRKMTYAPGR